MIDITLIVHCIVLYKQSVNIKRHTVESFKFAVAQILWYSWIALLSPPPSPLSPHPNPYSYEFTLSTIKTFRRDSFRTETENRLIHEIISIANNLQFMKVWHHNLK